MSELPKLDPVKLYNKALAQITDLNSQNIQMDALIEALKDERDAAIKERDKAQQQLSDLTKGVPADGEVLDGVVVE